MSAPDTLHTQRARLRRGESAKWERLADEAIRDASDWKARARIAEAQRDDLLAALRICEQLITREDTGSGWHLKMASISIDDAGKVRETLRAVQS